MKCAREKWFSCTVARMKFQERKKEDDENIKTGQNGIRVREGKWQIVRCKWYETQVVRLILTHTTHGKNVYKNTERALSHYAKKISWWCFFPLFFILSQDAPEICLKWSQRTSKRLCIAQQKGKEIEMKILSLCTSKSNEYSEQRREREEKTLLLAVEAFIWTVQY